MARLTLLPAFLILSLFSMQANGAGIIRVYSLPCGPGTYTIIPIAGFTHKPPYTLYAADGITVLAGPQASNVFTNIPGTVGSNFQVTVINVFSNLAEFTTITLNAGTSTINAQITCACTLGIPPDCSAVPRSDSITGAAYLWTSPSGLTYTRSGFSAPGNPPGIPENGVWTVSASLNTGTCIHNFSNSVTLSNCFSGMPVRLTYFRATTGSGCTINVEWATAQEQNSERFEIETSKDGMSGWEKVKATTAAGNSSDEIVYKETIAATGKGFIYIRLKQTDKDGHFDYSRIVKVTTNCGLSGTVLTVFPGIIPQNGTLTLKLSNATEKGGYYISCTDISGRQVFRKKIEVNMPESNHQVSISNLPNGTYFINVSNAASGQASNVTRFRVQ